jgi:hypothetical protein
MVCPTWRCSVSTMFTLLTLAGLPAVRLGSCAFIAAHPLWDVRPANLHARLRGSGRGLLNLKTVVPKPKGRIWYHNQSGSKVETTKDLFWYAFRGADSNNTRHRGLEDAMKRQLPLIYFYGVAPGAYEPLFPAFVADWNPEKLSCGLLRSILLHRARRPRALGCSGGARTASKPA